MLSNPLLKMVILVGEQVKIMVPYLDVSAACNLIRFRTCSDTIALLAELISVLGKDQSDQIHARFNANTAKSGHSARDVETWMFQN